MCVQDRPRPQRGGEGPGGEQRPVPGHDLRHRHGGELLHRGALHRCQVRLARPEDRKQLQGTHVSPDPTDFFLFPKKIK